jgi:hypothetical protein
VQKYEELLIFFSSFVILSLISLDNADDILAQPLPDSYDLSGPFPTTPKSDVELIEDIINGQRQINELEGIEPELPTRTDGSQSADDSASIVDRSNHNSDNHIHNKASEVNDYNKPISDKDEDADRQREISLVDDYDDRKDSHSSPGAGGVYG